MTSRAASASFAGLLGLACGALAATAPIQCNFELAVTWTIDSRGYGSESFVRMEGRWGVDRDDRSRIAAIRDGEPFLIRLIYLEGRLAEATGKGQDGEKALFEANEHRRQREGEEGAGNEPIAALIRSGELADPSSQEERANSLSSHWPQGFIHRGEHGLPELVLPLWKPEPLNGAAEEAAGCWWDWPKLEISYSRLRDLHALRRDFAQPVDHPEAAGCSGTMTVAIEALMAKTLPDPGDPRTTAQSCTQHGGVISIDGVWCVGGDYSCYRLLPVSSRKPKRKPS